MKRTTRKMSTICGNLFEIMCDISREIENSPDEMYRTLHAEYVDLHKAHELISKVMLERYHEGR